MYKSKIPLAVSVNTRVFPQGKVKSQLTIFKNVAKLLCTMRKTETASGYCIQKSAATLHAEGRRRSSLARADLFSVRPAQMTLVAHTLTLFLSPFSLCTFIYFQLLRNLAVFIASCAVQVRNEIVCTMVDLYA